MVVSSGKPGREIEPHLMAEHRQRAGAGAVALFDAVGENAFHQVEILAHGVSDTPVPQPAAGDHGDSAMYDAAGSAHRRRHAPARQQRRTD